MKTIKKSPSLAFAFGAICVATAAVLVLDALRLFHWILAVFWLGTGLLAMYLAWKK